jgi:hypothetical protein
MFSRVTLVAGAPIVPQAVTPELLQERVRGLLLDTGSAPATAALSSH